ncbi:MAG: tyrosinase family protein [Acidobacteria bacterium]|nr:tyrosinase family protein [Acidobacteriota bacterium]
MPKKPTTEKTTPPEQPRYERVKQILDDAQGDACPSYQGYKEFWRLPLAEFLGVSIYGVRMIAAVGEATAPSVSGLPALSSGGGSLPVMSCCHSDEAPPAQPAPTESDEDCCSAPSAKPKKFPGRGAASGLIKGLKGEYPFDDSQFPRLPWGGKTVSSGDIQFISDWIDDGCPATDENRSAIEVAESLVAALARGDADHPVSPRSINDYRHESDTIKARKNIAFLSPDELQRFRNVIVQMHKLDNFQQDERSFNYWARIHASNCQHGWEEFTTWHRAYLYFFELQMQDVDPTVTLPYWDWTWGKDTADDEADVRASVMDMNSSATLDNGIIPIPYRCWITGDGIKNLKQTGKVSPDDLNKLQKIVYDPKRENDTTYNSGNRLFAAAGITYGVNTVSDDAILNELRNINPLWYRFRWPGGNSGLIFEAYPTPQDIQNILALTNFFQFGSGPGDDHFFGALENIHNLLHNFSGGANPAFNPNNPNNPNEPQFGAMVSPGTTAFDPIFWGHHSNVDRLWAEWQQLHPNTNPDNLSAILPPWTMTVADTLNTSKLGYEYILSSHLYETNNKAPIEKFKSAPTWVHPQVLKQHRHAEVRLHNVQYSVNGGTFIRVFLNSPNADVNTPTTGNDRFVGQLQLFSGGCIGGPGHCDPPPASKRKFDQRPRHRKTPFNIKLDATDTIGKLKAKGETDMHISLVVMDLAGRQKSNSLWLDAVSLNFID